MMDSDQRSSISRRRIVGGAAWAVPTIVVATAAPAFAASCTGPTPMRQFVQPTLITDRDSAPSASFTFEVPAGVTTLNYKMQGATGGGPDGTANTRLGDYIEGTITVVPGTAVTMIAGNGGMGAQSSTSNQRSGYAGGQGYGNGGSSASPNSSATGLALPGASGGGGSAILIGGAPVAVAGGGGGAGNYIVMYEGTRTFTLNGGGGGAARTNGTNVTFGPSGIAPTTILSGGGANGATPGSSTPPDAPRTMFNGTVSTYQVEGRNPGSPPNAATGGNGGAGKISPLYSYQGVTAGTAVAGTPMQTSSAGGGGGYAGGAGGAAMGYIRKDGSPATNSDEYTWVVGAAGGGGSSYVNTTLATGTPRAGTYDGSGGGSTRDPGYVEITYLVPCP